MPFSTRVEPTKAKGHLVTTVAGFLYDQDGVRQFEDSWRERSKELTKPFRTSECFGGRGQFSGWPMPQRLLLMHDLADIVAKSRMAGFISSVEQGDFDEWARKDPMLRHIGSPYSLCLITCMEMAAQFLQKSGSEEDVFYWFEAGCDKQSEASRFLGMLERSDRSKKRFRIEGHGFASKAKAPILCSGDFLSWEWQRNMTELEEEKKSGGAKPWRSEFKAIIDANPKLLFLRDHKKEDLNFRAFIRALQLYAD